MTCTFASKENFVKAEATAIEEIEKETAEKEAPKLEVCVHLV